jgi:hypothetical protein
MPEKDFNIVDILNYHKKDFEIHHNVLAQPDFQFQAKGHKLNTINTYKKLQKDLA